MANEFKIKKGLIVTGSGGTVFDVQGSQGQLFSVTDSLTGVLFSVNDISGIPIFTVNSDDTINMGTYGAEAIKINGSSATISNLIITDSTLVSNLNADLLDGNHASYFINTSNIGSQTVSYANYAMSAGDAATLGGQAPSYYINTSNIGSQSVSFAYNSGNADTWGSYYLPTRTNWSSYNAQNIVVGQLAWRSNNNDHTIFDASAGLSPDNTSINNTYADYSWTSSYPTLMGWNGSNTYGVRVDRAQSSDYSDNSSYANQSYALYDQYNGGYLQGNYSSYGSFLVSGSRNNYHGFEFTGLQNGNVALMMYTTSNESGFYNTSYGWQTMWSNGSLYVFKNSYGGGSQATVLDSSNYTSYSVYGSGTNLYIPRFNASKSLTNSQLYDNGTNVGLNTTSMSGKFHVNGVVGSISIYASGDIVAYSDQSVKTNIRKIDNVLERVTKSRGVIYDRTDIEANDNIGFIAQELEVQFPELVSTSEDGTKAVKYQNATAVLFEAVKEQQKQIDELNEKINNILKLIEK